MNLYWVTTEDHDEDTFIIAPSARAARKYHEVADGYDPGDARAERILHLPTCGPDDIGWPSDEILRRCSAQIISQDSPRVVVIKGRRFCEGMFESELLTIHDDIFESHGQKRFNGTSRRPPYMS